MADILNEWGKADIVIPDFLKDIRDGVNEVAEFLLTVLNIANDVLDLIKNFVFDFANPINIILKELLGLVQSLLNDLRNLGVYVYKDIPTNAAAPFLQKRLEGGYVNFEERLTGAMLNSSDPNNPVFLFSENTSVFALFFYYSAPASLVHTFLDALKALLNLFSSKTTEISAVPTDLSFSYLIKIGNKYSTISSSAGVTDLGAPANAVKISWRYPEGAPMPVKAYVDISTYKNGLTPLFESAGPPHTTSSDSFYQICVDSKGRQVVLYGGHTLSTLKGENLKLFTQVDKPGIDYKDLEKYQVTKEVDLAKFSGFSLEDTVSFTLDFKDLPQNASRAFYVRIRTGEIKDTDTVWEYPEAISTPLEIKVPENLLEFTKLVAYSYLTVAVCKNTPLASESNTFRKVLAQNESSFRGLNKISDPEWYKNAIKALSERLVKDKLKHFTVLPKDYRDILHGLYYEELRAFYLVVTRGNLSPSGALLPSGEKLAKARKSAALKKQGATNVEYAVLYDDKETEQTPVSEVLRRDHSQALIGAARILGIVNSSEIPESAWEAYRFLPRVFPDVEGIFQEVNDFLETVLEGFKGIVEKIIKYIEAIQSRIAELQNFILRITALINALLLKIGSISSFNILLVEAQGGQGLMTNFLNADNKPADSELDLSAGIAVVFGGVPTLLVDTFKFIKENVISEGEQGGDSEQLPALPDGLEF